MRAVALLAAGAGMLAAGAGGLMPAGAGTDEAVLDGIRRGVIGGPHDLRDPSGGFDDACRACHVPHILAVRPTPPDQPGPPLELYRMPGQRAVFVPGRYTPGPTSLVCLGCHDGSLATSTLGSAHALLAGVRSGFAVDTLVSLRDHPIGVPYPRGDPGYRPAPLVEARGVRLPEGRVECVSCHDPHNRAGIDKMLVRSNRRSALCLTCHVK